MYIFEKCAAIWQIFGHAKNRCWHTQLNVCEKEEFSCFIYLIQIFGCIAWISIAIYERNFDYFSSPTQRFVCPIKLAYQTSHFGIEKGGCRNFCMDIFVVWNIFFLNSFVPLFWDLFLNILILTHLSISSAYI